MPFLDDTGPRDDPSRGPVAQAFAAFAGQTERLVAVNVAWAATLVPAFAAVAFGELPRPLRLLLLAVTAVGLPAATGVLFAVAAMALDGRHVGLDSVRDAAEDLALPGLRTLGPLYATVGGLLWLVALPLPRGVVVIVGWALLTSMVLAGYWGPALAAEPTRPPLALLGASLRLVWRRPMRSLVGAVAWGCVGALGVLSVGGLFLAVAVLVALVQTASYRVAQRRAPAEVARV